MVLVCPAILWTLLFLLYFFTTLVLHLADVTAFLLPCLCGRCYNHQVGVVTCGFISGRCYNHQADVIACSFYFCQMMPSFVVADVIAIVCNYGNFRMADVIVKVADVVATDCNCCNLADVFAKVGDVIATVCDSYHWQMILPRWLMKLPTVAWGVRQVL